VFLEVMSWVVDAVRFFNPFQAHSNEAWFTYSIVVWTIPIELKGSMLIYALSALHALRWISAPRSVLVWSIAAVALLQTGFWTMACFIGGLVLACVDVCALDTSLHGSRRLQVALHHVAFIFGYYLLCQPAHDGDPDVSLNTPGWHTLTRLIPRAYSKNQYYRYWNSWGALLLVYATLRIPWLQHVLKTRPLRYLGRVSFMFYLIHLPMQYMVGDRLSRAFGHLPLFAPKDSTSWWDNRLWVPGIGPPGFHSRFLLTVAVMLPLNLVVADFLTRVLDVPCVRLGKRLVQRLGLEKRQAGGTG
jgi:peptidoglycan/LPS O-acetylase OafA/YrhL